MTPLAWYLLLILALSAATLCLGFVSAGSERRRPITLLPVAHLAGAGVASAVAVLYFLGGNAGGAPLPHGRTPYRLEYTGFYGGLESALRHRLRWTGDQSGKSFLLPASAGGSVLRPAESIELVPELGPQPQPGGSGAQPSLAWLLSSSTWSLPLRIDGRCVNLAAERWLRSGDTLLIRSPQTFFSVQWLEAVDGDRRESRFLFNQGQIENGQPVSDLTAPVLISRLSLRDGRRLSAMLKRYDWTVLWKGRRQRHDSLRAWFAAAWGRLSGRAPAATPALRPAVSIATFEKRRREVLRLSEQVIWVRQQRDDPASALGVLLGQDFFDGGTEATRVAAAGERLPLVRPSHAMVKQNLAGGQEVRYGLAGEKLATLRPGKRPFNDHVLGLVIDVDLVEGPSWNLPQPPTEPFLIMSKETPARLAGFLIDSGLDREPFYAKAHYLEGKGSFAVNNGADDLGPTFHDGRAIVLPGDKFRLGGFERGVVLRFPRDSSPIASPGPLGAGGLAAGALICAFLLYRDRGSSRFRLDLLWAVACGLVLALLVVRLVLAYRLAVLPPMDVTAQERADLFSKSLRVALDAVWLVPLALALSRWLARGWRREGVLGRRPSALRRQVRRAADAAGRVLPPGWSGGWGRALQRAREVAAPRPAEEPEVSATRRRRLRIWWGGLPLGLRAAAVVLGLWLAAGVLLGHNEAVGGVRVNLVAQLLIILGLAAAAAWLARPGRRRRILFIATWLFGTVLLVILEGDNGFIIHLPYLLLSGLLILLWERQHLGLRLVATAAVVAALLAVGVFLLPMILQKPWADRWVTWAVNPADSHVYYRLAPRGLNEELLTRPVDPDAYNMQLLRRNSQQRWQMLLYASEGLAHTPGYGGAPLSRVAMTYATSLTDCVFASYLLAEHGGLAGFFLLLVYAGLAAVLISSGWFLSDPRRSRALTLTAIGGYFGVTALYMATTNLGWLFFTGQNMPLLSLVSRTDLVASTALLCLATWLVRSGIQASTETAMPRQPWARRLGIVTVMALFFWCLLLAGRMRAVAAQERSFRRDFTFPEVTLNTYASHLPEAGKSEPLALEGTRIRIRDDGSVSWVEKGLVELFNHQQDKLDPAGSFYYLESAHGVYRLRINRSYFNVSSPFHSASPWSGTIEAQGPELPTLHVLGENVTLRPGHETAGKSIDLSGRVLPDTEQSTQIVLTRALGGQTFNLCQIQAREGDLYIKPYHGWGHGRAQWAIHVDGQTLDHEHKLAEGEIVRFTSSVTDRHGRPRRRFDDNLLYAGRQGPFLAFSRWRNGSMQRSVTAGSTASLVEELGKVLDAQHGTRGLPPPAERVILTLRPELQRRLEQVLARQAKAIYHDSDSPARRRGISLAVLDATSGEVFALPTWPGGLAETADEGEGGQQRNDNLRNHIIGSTIKPIVLSAVATGYWPAGFDVGELAVRHQSDCSPPEARSHQAHPHWHCGIAGVQLDTPYNCQQPGKTGLIQEGEFLTSSVNFYEVVLGMLGMGLDPRDWPALLASHGARAYTTEVVYRGQVMHLDLRRAPPRRAVFTFDDQEQGRAPSLKVVELEQTILFRQLPALFTVELELDTSKRDAYESYIRKSVAGFYPGLAGSLKLSDERVTAVLPDVINLRPGDFQKTRGDLVSLFIGGASHGRWSNVRLAEAAARIATGKRITARLGTEQAGATADPPISPMPEPLSRRDWRLRRLVDPMAEVGVQGTAKELRGVVNAARKRGYRVIFKTGTLEETPGIAAGGPAYESELLMMVIGKWQEDDFVPGKTLAAVLYLDDSKVRDSDLWRRNEVAKPVLDLLLGELERRAAPRTEAH